jgi:catechol 2,3-dioxygenase-like lactoylglutathione lyase family enzyme
VPRKLSFVTLWAVHFDEIKKLYRDKLGFPVVDENPNFIMFGTTGARLPFHKLPEAPALIRRTVEIRLEVEDVDSAHEKLLAKGIVFDEKPSHRPRGLRMVSFRDPDGYHVELVGPLKKGEPIRGY